MNEDATNPTIPLGYYCRTCSAAPGTPCNNPLTGQDVMPHRARLALSTAANLATWDA